MKMYISRRFIHIFKIAFFTFFLTLIFIKLFIVVSSLNRLVINHNISTLIRKYKVNWNYSVIQDPWKVANDWLTGRYVHPEHTPELGAVLQAMTRRKILSADVLKGGTQLKLILELEGGQKCVFRPKRHRLDKRNNGFREGYNKHNTEIAAFHIGRILGFRRAPIVVGRYVNVDTEIVPIASEKIKRKLVNDSKKNRCLLSPSTDHIESDTCADGAILEGAVALWLPKDVSGIENHWLKRWETSEQYCNISFMTNGLFTEDHLMLDIIDTSIFDFLIGNVDRHTQYILREGNASMVAMIDNAFSFGNPHYNVEIIGILSPLYKCCRIRESTLTRLNLLKGILGGILSAVLSDEPIAPVLEQAHYDGLDRRLHTAISTVQNCIVFHGEQTVVIRD